VLTNPQVLQSTTSYGVSDNFSYLSNITKKSNFIYKTLSSLLQSYCYYTIKIYKDSSQLFQQLVFCTFCAAPWLEQRRQYQLITFTYFITVNPKRMKSHNDFIKQFYNQANVSVYTLHTEQSFNQTENGVCCDTVHRVHQGILYFQNVMLLQYTHIHTLLHLCS
jgi:hypothetical protein